MTMSLVWMSRQVNDQVRLEQTWAKIVTTKSNLVATITNALQTGYDHFMRI